jgi:hypothetical protein
MSSARRPRLPATIIFSVGTDRVGILSLRMCVSPGVGLVVVVIILPVDVHSLYFQSNVYTMFASTEPSLEWNYCLFVVSITKEEKAARQARLLMPDIYSRTIHMYEKNHIQRSATFTKERH